MLSVVWSPGATTIWGSQTTRPDTGTNAGERRKGGGKGRRTDSWRRRSSKPVSHGSSQHPGSGWHWCHPPGDFFLGVNHSLGHPSITQWIGLREKNAGKLLYLMAKPWFPVDFPTKTNPLGITCLFSYFASDIPRASPN